MERKPSSSSCYLFFDYQICFRQKRLKRQPNIRKIRPFPKVLKIYICKFCKELNNANCQNWLKFVLYFQGRGKQAPAFKVHLNWDLNKLNYSLFVTNITSQYLMKDISRDCGDNFKIMGLRILKTNKH